MPLGYCRVIVALEVGSYQAQIEIDCLPTQVFHPQRPLYLTNLRKMYILPVLHRTKIEKELQWGATAYTFDFDF